MYMLHIIKGLLSLSLIQGMQHGAHMLHINLFVIIKEFVQDCKISKFIHENGKEQDFRYHERFYIYLKP
jgi:hypothetical protein